MNRFFTKLMTVVMTAMISLSVNPYKVADAGCNCQKGSSVMNSMPMQSMQMSSPYNSNMNMAQSAPMNALPALPAIAAPAGSLGYTYKRRSRLIPKDKHPRVGMVEITGIPQGYNVIVDGMKGYVSESGTRVFESKRPLLPHRKHIYRIEVRQTEDQLKPEVRTIRLISGRIVDYEFK